MGEFQAVMHDWKRMCKHFWSGDPNKPSVLYSEVRLNQIRQYDAIKNEYAMKHGIPLVRIPYSKKGAITLDLLFSDKYLVSA